MSPNRYAAPLGLGKEANWGFCYKHGAPLELGASRGNQPFAGRAKNRNRIRGIAQDIEKI